MGMHRTRGSAAAIGLGMGRLALAVDWPCVPKQNLAQGLAFAYSL